MSARLPDEAQQARHVVEPPGLRVQHGKPHALQSVDVRRAVAADPDDDQIGFQRQDALEVDAAVVADARKHFRHRGIVAGAVDTHQLRTGTDGKQQFGEMRGQGNDALRWPGEFERLPDVVDHAKGGRLRRHRQQQA